ncbi:antigen WC1.1-like [Dendropsophus ebraccatus]|uniref:antigen WC1.1-like n=1 Tax=Dendropsophus ebraccatus TaxID=150705 RepID=UPI0038317599
MDLERFLIFVGLQLFLLKSDSYVTAETEDEEHWAPVGNLPSKCQASCMVLSCEHKSHLWTSGPHTMLMKSKKEDCPAPDIQSHKSKLLFEDETDTPSPKDLHVSGYMPLKFKYDCTTPTTINGQVYLKGNYKGDETQLTHCSVTGASDKRIWNLYEYNTNEYCLYFFYAETNELRLVSAASPCAGRVEMYRAGRWRTICGHLYNNADAEVICKQLGCGSVVQVTRGDDFGEATRDTWLKGLQCRGNETNIKSCPEDDIGVYNCYKNFYAGVICSAHREYRLVDGPNDCSGHLEALHGNTWGSVCEIELRAANVLCKELQCGEAVPSSLTYTRRPGPIWTKQIHCTGNESRLYDCKRVRRGKGNCIKPSPPSIQCKGLFNSYRLVNSSQDCSGRVEVLYNGQWMAVCRSHWTLQAANVLCKQMKCGVAASVPDGGHFGQYNVTTTYRFHCTGGEYHLGDCNITALGNSNCPSWDTAGVICTGKKETGRLMDGEDHCAGRLEILTNSTWSRAVSDQWGINETQVVCRELHCGHAVDTFIITSPTTNNSHVYLRGICQGNESQLKECSVTGESDIKTHGDTGNIEVICSESKRIRLVNGSAQCAGRVEIYHAGRWGTICDDSWDKADADVVCKQLGCGFAVTATTEAYYGRGTGDIWMDDVQCRGNETHIWDCPSKQLGDHNCGHKEDAGVICSEFLDIRLVEGKQECEGWLEVYYNGSWSSVCENMPDVSVYVICKHLNCGSTGRVETGLYETRKRPFWVDHINCTKYSKLLWECPSSPWNTESCSDREVAYIVYELKRKRSRCGTSKDTWSTPVWLSKDNMETQSLDTNVNMVEGESDNPINAGRADASGFFKSCDRSDPLQLMSTKQLEFKIHNLAEKEMRLFLDSPFTQII